MIVTDPEGFFSAGMDAAYDGLRSAKRARLYGLLSKNTEFAPYIRGLVISTFGMREVVVPNYGKIRRRVHVQFLKMYGGEPVPNHRDDLVIKHDAGGMAA